MSKEARRGDQADLSAEPTGAEAPSRLPRANGDQGGAQGSVPPPGQGPQAPVSLIGLKRRSQFLQVRQGAKAVRPSLIVEARRRGPDGPIGFGLTASKKVGNAVVRNRARRRLREAARQILPRLGEPGVDYVLVARAATPHADWAALLDDLGNALIRLRADLDRPIPGGKPARSRRSAKAPSTESD